MGGRMRTKQIVVIGASAGGIEALREVVAGLPADFPAPICLVLHTSPQAPAVLDSILARSGPLAARNARDGDRLIPGLIYVAAPDCHLLVEPDVVRVTKGPRENRFRPAIDPLFRSAAQVYGPGAIGVVLTGNLDDGTAGLWAVKQLGGTAIVQHPDDALFPAMPLSALRHVRVDHSVPVAGLAPLLVQLTSKAEPESVEVPVPETLEVEVKIAKEENPLDAGIRQIAEPSVFACPECHGVLLQLKEGGPIRFRCHTGHAYSSESLVSGINEAIEEAVWNAIRALEEGDMLMRAMSTHMESHSARQADELKARAAEAKRQSEVIRQLAMDRQPLVTKP
jgi:two-component system, chemotaxis family, protein-glutamate methylesterase/glutaminase